MKKNIRNKIGLYLFIIIFSLGLLYAYKQTKNFSRGPVLEIQEPQSGITIYNPIISVKAFVKNVSFISINERQIFSDENGLIDENLLLSPGYNIINIKAEDKYQRETKKELEIVYKK